MAVDEYDGQWGYVCNDRWDDRDATVVCRQLGQPTGKKHDGMYGWHTSPVTWMNKVACSGAENLLDECSFKGWGVYGCDATKDAYVCCGQVYAH
jgi:serine protease 12 (motopsin)